MTGGAHDPPRLIRRLVLAPLVVIIAAGFLVLSPFLALLALIFGLLARPRAGHMRSLRLVGFALVWFVAETMALIMLSGLWVVSGFGGPAVQGLSAELSAPQAATGRLMTRAAGP